VKNAALSRPVTTFMILLPGEEVDLAAEALGAKRFGRLGAGQTAASPGVSGAGGELLP
jgi:hypothetical protein